MLKSASYYLIVLNVVLLEAKPSADEKFSVIGTEFDTHAKIEADGYTAQSHSVVTPDGYVLQLHRIPFGKDQVDTGSRTPVLLMHGITDSSVAYVRQGPEYAIGYNLADAGFDVWIGNARGNRNSRAHITLNPDDRNERIQFFDFSWDEMGRIDLPTMVDYVLQVTGQNRLHYIGHSQGGTMYLVLNSMHPEYNDKFISAHLLAAVGYMEHFPHRLLVLVSRYVNLIYRLSLRLGIVELFPPNYNIGEIMPFQRSNLNCTSTHDDEIQELCDVMEHMKLEPRLGSGAGAAVKQLAHFGQNIKSKLFQRFDYGAAENVIRYGTEEPPIYDISRITVATVMHYTIADEILDERDVIAMSETMSNAVVRKVPKDTFEHADFVMTDDTKELVTDFIIDQMLSFTDGQQIAPTPQPSSSNTYFMGSTVMIYLIAYLFSTLIIANK